MRGSVGVDDAGGVAERVVGIRDIAERRGAVAGGDAVDPLAAVDIEGADLAVGVAQCLRRAVGMVGHVIDIRQRRAGPVQGVGQIAYLPQTRIGEGAELIEVVVGISRGERLVVDEHDIQGGVAIGVIGITAPGSAILYQYQVIGLVVIKYYAGYCLFRIVDVLETIAAVVRPGGDARGPYLARGEVADFVVAQGGQPGLRVGNGPWQARARKIGIAAVASALVNPKNIAH